MSLSMREKRRDKMEYVIEWREYNYSTREYEYFEKYFKSCSAMVKFLQKIEEKPNVDISKNTKMMLFHNNIEWF